MSREPKRPAEVKLARFGNYTAEAYTDDEGRSKVRLIPHGIRRIEADREELTPGWPKRVGERLFVESDRGRPVYLNSAARFLAWLHAHAAVDWTKGSRFVTQEQFYESQRMGVEQYDSIEMIPHQPPYPTSWYMHPPLPEPSGALDALLDRFSPATPADRSLIAAMILTPAWGGLPGSRPAFLIAGPDHDAEQGRGVGKTTLLDLVANEIYGGSIDIGPNEMDMAVIKTRLLSERGESMRIARMDNVKSPKLSSAEMEGLITASEISGRMLFRGEGKRRNDLTRFITANGAGLSKDLAQRVVTIKLSRPSGGFNARWQDETVALIRSDRWGLIADIVARLAAEPGEITARTRYASWERGVLAKLPLAAECQAAIVERQRDADEGDADREMVREAIRSLLARSGHNPDEAIVCIPSRAMAEIVSIATRRHHDTSHASRFVGGLGISELRSYRSASRRGWVWTGPSSDPGASHDIPTWEPPDPMSR